MAIVTMKRMTLLAMQADKDKIYDALVRTNAVQLKRSTEIPKCSTVNPSDRMEKLAEKVNRVEESIAFLAHQTELYNLSHKGKQQAEFPKNSFARPRTEMDYQFFLGFGKNVQQVEEQLARLAQLRSSLSQAESDLAQKTSEKERMLPYKDLPHPTVWYKDTESSFVQLSQLHVSEWQKLQTLADGFDLVSVEKVCEYGNVAVVVAVVHKSQAEFFREASSLGLVKSNVRTEVLPRLVIKDLEQQCLDLVKVQKDTVKQIVEMDGCVTQWKTYVDYLGLCLKKAEADGDLQNTAATYVLEGYCPADSQELVQQAIQNVSMCTVVNFDDIGEEEFAPTLTRNNAVVKQFEFITNMYTPPDYHEVDPNPVMSVFYFIIFGFMVADVGYGLLLLLAGVFAHFAIKQSTGLRTMLQLFGICGIAAILVGLLFGSCFSYSLFETPLIPDPSKYPMVTMILSLILGIVHIVAGVACNMAVKIKHKQALSAWLTDFPWIVAFLALILAIFNAALDMAGYSGYDALRLPDIVSKVSLYVCLGAVGVAVVFAGLGTKGILGKIMKSFGSAYGLINYFSDIMSYIRVFGLMLSSALMGVVVNQLGAMVSAGGGIGYVFAALVLVFAHMFNLIMGILGVYIHNGRLQYVEFFGKFYTGDGKLFLPFGSDTKYVLVQETKGKKN